LSASAGEGVATFDISDPANPKTLLGQLVTGKSEFTLEWFTARVFINAKPAGLRVYDFSAPAKSRNVG